MSDEKAAEPIFESEANKAAFMDTVYRLLEEEGRVHAALEEAKYLIGDLPADEQAKLEASIRTEVHENMRKHK